MTPRALHLWLAKAAVERGLRAAERFLPTVAAALPPDRAGRATWAFAQLRDALEGRQATTQPDAAPGQGGDNVVQMEARR